MSPPSLNNPPDSSLTPDSRKTYRVVIPSFLITTLVGLLLVYTGWTKSQLPGLFLRDVLAYEIVSVSAGSLIAAILPKVEIILGICLLLRIHPSLSLASAAVLFAIFLIAQVSATARGLVISCGCFSPGTGEHAIESEVVSTVSILRTLLLLLVALVGARLSSHTVEAGPQNGFEMRKVRTVGFVVLIVMISVGLSSSAHAGSVFDTPVSLADLKRYAVDMQCSDAQWHSIRTIHSNYIRLFDQIEAKLAANRADNTKSLDGIAPQYTLSRQIVMRLEADLALVKRARGQVRNADDWLFSSIGEILTNEQLAGLAWSRDDRIMQSGNYEEFLERTGLAFFNLNKSEVLRTAVANHNVAVRDMLHSYSKEMGRLCESLDTKVPLIQINMHQAMADAGVDDEQTILAERRGLWSIYGADALIIANRIDDLTLSYVSRIDEVLTLPERLSWRVEVTCKLFPEVRREVARQARLISSVMDAVHDAGDEHVLEAVDDSVSRLSECFRSSVSECKAALVRHEPNARPKDTTDRLIAIRNVLRNCNQAEAESLSALLGERSGQIAGWRDAVDPHTHQVGTSPGEVDGDTIEPSYRKITKVTFKNLVECIAYDSESAKVCLAAFEKYSTKVDEVTVNLPVDEAKHLSNIQSGRDHALNAERELCDVLRSECEDERCGLIVSCFEGWRAIGQELSECMRASGAAGLNLFDLVFNDSAVMDNPRALAELATTTRATLAVLGERRAAYSLDADERVARIVAFDVKIAVNNLECLDRMVVCMDDEDGAKLKSRFEHMAYPEVFVDNGSAQPIIGEHLRRHGLPQDVGDAVRNIAISYSEEYDRLTAGMLETVRLNTFWVTDDGQTLPFDTRSRSKFKQQMRMRDHLNQKSILDVIEAAGTGLE